MSDLRPDMDVIMDALGVAATVTPVGGAAIATTIIVRSPSTPTPDGARATAVEARKEATILKADVATLKNRSRIVIADGPDAGTYSVDDLVHEDGEVFVVRIAEVDA